MNNRTRRWCCFGLVSAGSLTLQGCPNPNLYQTPRTTPKNKVSHVIAAEAIGYRADVTTTDSNGETTTETESGTLPMAPTYQLRYGATDEVDVGFRVSNFASIGADVKWNFLKGAVDAAIDPGVQYYSLSVNDESLSVVYLTAPVPIGFNFDESISLVLSPAVTFAFVSGDLVTDDGKDSAFGADGMLAQLGAGLDLRVSDHFALHPMVTFFGPLATDTGSFTYIAGLGFKFGELPGFADQAPTASASEDE